MRTATEFWAAVHCGPVNECWEWRKHRTKSGYGRLNWCGVMTRAHRLAWMLHSGQEIPDGLVVLHACDNPACCNPDHLSVGSHADNHRDSAGKRRRKEWYDVQKACRNGHALTPGNILLVGESRYCRMCRLAWREQYNAKRRQERLLTKRSVST